MEILVALAVTAFVAAAAYAGVSQRHRRRGEHPRGCRTHCGHQPRPGLLTRDIRQFVDRGVRDEFGQEQPGLTGGRLARFP